MRVPGQICGHQTEPGLVTSFCLGCYCETRSLPVAFLSTQRTFVTPGSPTPNKDMIESSYTIVQNDDDKEQPSVQELKSQLENGKDEQKVETMKKILLLMLNGDPCTQLLMHIIRFVMPSRSKDLKKLLLIYWEICPKTNPDGKLKQEMILVCNALRNDLQHPNEFVRGMTLRFLCKLKEAELLEPLVPAEHRHSYVRKNAVLAIYAIYKNFDFLIPDAPEMMQTYLASEADMNCKRNAFVMLANTKQALAIQFLAIVELIRKDARTTTPDKGKYIQVVFSLLHSSSPAVKYDAACTLVALTSHTSAVKAAASCFIGLAVKESDNNIKLIVLDRIRELIEKHQSILEDVVMDILRILTSPDIDVRRKCLKLSMDLVSSRNVDEVVTFLKKELAKTHDGGYEKNAEYRQLLIQAIHSCAINFSEVAANVVHILMEFLGETNHASAVDVIAFVREVIEKFPHLRNGIIQRLLDSFSDMKSGRVFRGALWIVGEYALDLSMLEETFKSVRAAIGELPILAYEQRLLEEAREDRDEKDGKDVKSPSATQTRRVLADGTYATESAYSQKEPTTPRVDSRRGDRPPLRSLILNGDYFLGSVLCTALTKLILRYIEVCPDKTRANAQKSEAMLIMTGIIRVGRSDIPSAPIDEDSHDRIITCIRTLSAGVGDADMRKVFLADCRTAFAQMITAENKKHAESRAKDKSAVKAHVDDLISFRYLKSKKAGGDVADEYQADLLRATGINERGDEAASRLHRIMQLTGFSDRVYAEAYVDVHQYDVLLDVLIVNQTNETLQNLTLEFSTLGDLKLVERPTPHTMGPHSFHNIKANIKVSSTETGVIFGNIVYDGPTAADSQCIILNDIHIDIMDYIKPATCTETQFRAMWVEFEWENKVNVNTNISNLRDYLNHIMKSTNMSCLTPEHALSGDCGFLAANMYARSIFGEDALANISLEQTQAHGITGHIRIRSKTQGIALSLGDKITLCQKDLPVTA